MLKYLIVMLAENSVPFCYYNFNKKYLNKPELIPVNVLEEIINYAHNNILSLSFLYNNQLTDEYEELIEKSLHIKFIPIEYELTNKYTNRIVIINDQDIDKINQLEESNTRNIILRISVHKITSLNDIFDLLLNKFKRLNLTLLDVDEYNDDICNLYKEQLNRIMIKTKEIYKRGHSVEINFLSDRILLNSMNNCNAGIDHVTVAPNGKFYLCPGFYHDSKKNSIGSLQSGPHIPESELLQLDRAPVCSICDAYHCKRCIWMNIKHTSEINIPSHEQCVLSHLERKASGELLSQLKNTDGFNDFDNIPYVPEVDYLDPLDVIKGKAEKVNFENKLTDIKEKRLVNENPYIQNEADNSNLKKLSNNPYFSEEKETGLNNDKEDKGILLNIQNVLLEINNNQLKILDELKNIRIRNGL